MSNHDEDETRELPAKEYLKDLAERLMRVPAVHGVDGYDVDRIYRIANAMPEISED